MAEHDLLFTSMNDAGFEKALQEKLAERMTAHTAAGGTGMIASDNKIFGCTGCPGECKCTGQGSAIAAGEYAGSWAGSVYVD